MSESEEKGVDPGDERSSAGSREGDGPRAPPTPLTTKAIREWRRRFQQDPAVAAANDDDGVQQVTGGESCEAGPRDGINTLGPREACLATAALCTLDSPWLARMARDFCLHPPGRKMFAFSTGVTNSATKLIDARERYAYMVDLYYQKQSFSRTPPKEQQQREQSWKDFVKAYAAGPEAWHQGLEKLRDDYENWSANGLKMRIHRLALEAGFPCAVSRAYDCPLCPPGSSKFEDKVLKIWYEDKPLPYELVQAVARFEKHNVAGDPPHIICERLRHELLVLERENQELQLTLQHEQQMHQALLEECERFSRRVSDTKSST